MPGLSGPRFREYVIRQGHPSYHYDRELRLGVALPEDGVTYYEVPSEYRVTGYRYTYVNGRAVLVDPRTQRRLQVRSRRPSASPLRP